jgi:hypothetical protein
MDLGDFLAACGKIPAPYQRTRITMASYLYLSAMKSPIAA